MTYSVPSEMVAVSKEQFFGTVGNLNVHPRTLVETFREPETVSVWEMLDGSRRRVGVSLSKFGSSRYFVVPEFAKGASR